MKYLNLRPISLINNEIGRGPSTEPCRTPECMFLREDEFLDELITAYCLLRRFEANHLTVESMIPKVHDSPYQFFCEIK